MDDSNRTAKLGQRWVYVPDGLPKQFIAEIVFCIYSGDLEPRFYGRIVQTYDGRRDIWPIGKICRDPEEFLNNWIYLEGQDNPSK
jgi:hypothetical protein